MIGPGRIWVSWDPPSIPPGNGYQITVNNDISRAVNVSRSPHTIDQVAPGVRHIQVRSLSQHYLGRMVERVIHVVGKEVLLEKDV